MCSWAAVFLVVFVLCVCGEQPTHLLCVDTARLASDCSGEREGEKERQHVWLPGLYPSAPCARLQGWNVLMPSTARETTLAVSHLVQGPRGISPYRPETATVCCFATQLSAFKELIPQSNVGVWVVFAQERARERERMCVNVCVWESVFGLPSRRGAALRGGTL